VGLCVVGAGLYGWGLTSGLKRRDWTPGCLIVAALVVYLPNLIPGDIYPNYLVPALPFMAVAGGVTVVEALRRLTGFRQMGLAAWALMCVAWGVAASATYLPRVVSWPPQLPSYREAADYLAKRVSTTRPVFTFETLLAVEAGLAVEHGMEMSYFSFFPGWPTGFCRDYHLLNDEVAAEDLAKKQFAAIIMSDFDLHLLRDRTGAPRRSSVDPLVVLPELKGRYTLDRTFAGMGLFRDNLYIMLPLTDSTVERPGNP
jgi:hypothetical protein